MSARLTPQATADPEAARTLTAVRATREDGDVLITVEGDGKLVASAVQVPDAAPPRLVLDFAGVSHKVAATTAVNTGLVRRVRVARNSASPLVTRLVVDLSGTFLYKVRPAADQQSLVVTIGNPAQRARRDDEAQSRAVRRRAGRGRGSAQRPPPPPPAQRTAAPRRHRLPRRHPSTPHATGRRRPPAPAPRHRFAARRRRRCRPRRSPAPPSRQPS